MADTAAMPWLALWAFALAAAVHAQDLVYPVWVERPGLVTLGEAATLKCSIATAYHNPAPERCLWSGTGGRYGVKNFERIQS